VVDVDAIAGLQAAHTWSDCLDDTRRIEPGSVGKRRLFRVGARANISIHGIYPGSFHRDDNLIGRRLRIRDIFKSHDSGRAKPGMRMNRRHGIFAAILMGGLLMAVVPAQNSDRLPSSLSDNEFRQLLTEFSEPDGSFPSPNFVSNERSFQSVLANLAAAGQQGSGYIGVGPEQNFTYLLAVKPKIAFILDIRRQNLVLHLMYKALFEMSSDRADFLSRLFSRPRPANLSAKSNVEELFAAFRDADADANLLVTTHAAVVKRLTEDHKVALTDTDLASLSRVLSAFHAGGPFLTYAGVYANPNLPTRIIPTFEELMLETDAAGKYQSFLATEENFRRIQDLQKKNLIIPVVGNFAGPGALRAIGRYLQERGAIVSAFYTSNVEQYLFGDRLADSFYTNVALLPLDEKSVIIRALVRHADGELSPSPLISPTTRLELGLYPMKDLVKAHAKGDIQTYSDILKGRF
jgi:hypothetical protein